MIVLEMTVVDERLKEGGGKVLVGNVLTVSGDDLFVVEGDVLLAVVNSTLQLGTSVINERVLIKKHISVIR